MQNSKHDLPWNIIITRNIDPIIEDLHNVHIKILINDRELREKILKSNTLFSVDFQTYLFNKSIKAARIKRSNHNGTLVSKEQIQCLSTEMTFSFNMLEKAVLFEQGIERALDNFIMELILEDKQDTE